MISLISYLNIFKSKLNDQFNKRVSLLTPKNENIKKQAPSNKITDEGIDNHTYTVVELLKIISSTVQVFWYIFESLHLL